MSGHIGYIRVSTVKQGTTGVSLLEQKDAILRYAQRHGLTIDLWLEETETAARRGRRVFMQAVKLLRQRKFRGMILHKLDRGARNLRDWAEIAELADLGGDIHFAHESLDLHTRGGRLSADIQAVVAADYIRNLRDETRKGFYGRLKQGLYPLQAPLGYQNNGKGKPKTIDPRSGPLVRTAFDLYASGKYSLGRLAAEMHRRGLRNRRKRRVTMNGFSTMLNNPFYIGIIRIEKTNETFRGIHAPLISKSLFDQVQRVIKGKYNARSQRHSFAFSRLFTCADCGYSVIGELQKGHVYYRCHTRECSKPSVREDVIERSVRELVDRLQFAEEEKTLFREKLALWREEWARHDKAATKSNTLLLQQLSDRLKRLTDAYLDNVLDKASFEERKAQLLIERATVQEQLSKLKTTGSQTAVRDFLELAESVPLSYKNGFPEDKREIVRAITSNRQVNRKNVVVEPSLPFAVVANRFESASCDLQRDIPRTCERLLAKLIELEKADQLPSVLDNFIKNHDTMDEAEDSHGAFSA